MAARSSEHVIMPLVPECRTRSIVNPLRWSLPLGLLMAASMGGCSTIDMPADANLVTQDSREDEEHLAEVRKTALADPFPTAAEAGLKPGAQ